MAAIMELEVINSINTPDPDERDLEITYEYLLKGREQRDIAGQFGMTQGRVSQIVNEVLRREDVLSKLMVRWEKSYTFKAMRLSSELLDNVSPDNHPPQKRVVDSATLVDKIRLINDKSTENIAVVISEEDRPAIEAARKAYAESRLNRIPTATDSSDNE